MSAESTGWDPQAYLQFSSERLQPLVDLIHRIRHPNAASVLDLGCGAGNAVPVIRATWPQARVLGIDSSPEMLRTAEGNWAGEDIRFHQADIRSISSAGLPQEVAETGEVDVIISNAALHWLPDHRQLLPGLMEILAPGGALAVQVPGNFSNPSHRLLYEMAAAEPYAQHIDPSRLLRPTAEPSDYLQEISRPGWEVEAWETTYLHILQGPDPVFEWISATGAKPVLEQLPPPVREDFIGQYKAALRDAYPASEIGTVLPFRRIFFIARRTG